MRLARSSIKVLLPLAALLLASACGGDDSGESASTDAPAAETTPPADADGATTTAAAATTAAADTTAPTDTAAAAAGTTEVAPSGELTKLTLAYPAAIEQYSAPFIAAKTGAFAAAGFDVEFVQLPSADILPALNSGDVDVAVLSAGAGMLNSISQGFDLRVVAPVFLSSGNSSAGWYLRPEFVADPQRLEGQQVSSFSGESAVGMYVLGDYLTDNGVSIADVQIVRMDADAAPVALEQGVLAAAYLSPPQSDDVVAKGFATKVADFAPGAAPGGLGFGPEMLSPERRDEALAFLAAFQTFLGDHMTGDYRSDPAVLSALSEFMGVPGDAIAQTEPIAFTDDFDMSAMTAALERYQKYMFDIGGVLAFDAPLSADQVIDTSYAEDLKAAS